MWSFCCSVKPCTDNGRTLRTDNDIQFNVRLYIDIGNGSTSQTDYPFSWHSVSTSCCSVSDCTLAMTVHHRLRSATTQRVIRVLSCVTACDPWFVLYHSVWSVFCPVSQRVIRVVLCHSVWSVFCPVSQRVIRVVLCHSVWSALSCVTACDPRCPVSQRVIRVVLCHSVWSALSCVTACDPRCPVSQRVIRVVLCHSVWSALSCVTACDPRCPVSQRVIRVVLCHSVWSALSCVTACDPRCPVSQRVIRVVLCHSVWSALSCVTACDPRCPVSQRVIRVLFCIRMFAGSGSTPQTQTLKLLCGRTWTAPPCRPSPQKARRRPASVSTSPSPRSPSSESVERISGNLIGVTWSMATRSMYSVLQCTS